MNNSKRSTRLWLMLALSLILVLAAACAAPAGDAGSDAGDAADSGGEMAEDAGMDMAAIGADCGLGNGETASGEAIKIGAIVAETGGDDFSSAADSAKAYFDCVNANGGINGRPIEYLVEDDQWNPEVAAQGAAKLVQDEGVVALAANASFLEMAINANLYEEEDVMVIAAACAIRECFEAKNIASTNAGPLGSNLGMIQWAIENLGTVNVACIGFAIPNNGGWSCDAVNEYVAAQGGTGTSVLFDPGAADFTATVLEATATGADTMLVNLPGGAALGIMKAAEEQDLRDSYIWTAPTPLYDLAIPDALGAYWDGAVHVHMELTEIDGTGPDATHWRAVMDAYGRDEDPRDTFSQAGYVSANIVVDTLMGMDVENITRETVSEALRGVSGYESDLMCGPYYVGPGDRHFPNHYGQIALIKGGGFEIVEGCFETVSSYFDDVIAIEEELGLR